MSNSNSADEQERTSGDYAAEYSDTTDTDEGSQGRPFGGTRLGVGTGMSIGASRGNTGPGTGSDETEAQYTNEDFEGSTPGTAGYEGGGMPNTRVQGNSSGTDETVGLGDAANLTPSSVGGAAQDSPTLEDNYNTATGSHGGGTGDTGAQRGHGATAMGDTQGLGDDDTDAYKE